MGASVKVMLSYDYCHFEICKSTDQPVTDSDVDAMRKDCMRLADKAIRQYKTAKNAHNHAYRRRQEMEAARQDIEHIRAKAEGDRTPNEMAKVKAFEDRKWQEYIDERYDYQDDWEDDDHED